MIHRSIKRLRKIKRLDYEFVDSGMPKFDDLTEYWWMMSWEGDGEFYWRVLPKQGNETVQ